ncbi:hypothetical protein DXG03_008675 [Asterophora parasitica]|uniref:BZIP domain-containing protein n=1 Tax=Asterophora parasitica TaxID=117018 RepID=A0A9P7GBR8_9AGAR|nr:hypothetical protein DXG03_008675 [Asterophora parasitica]
MWDDSTLEIERYVFLSPSDESTPVQHYIKSELTESSDSRILRPSTVLPRPSPSHPTTSTAIPASNYTHNINTCQDVPIPVNSSASYLSSPVTRTDAFSHYLGPSVSSSSTPSHHVLTHRRQRPRTSNQVFTSSYGIAPHGIPQSLPPAPSTAPRRNQPPPVQPPLPDFNSLASNYLNMLSQKPTDNTMTAHSTTTPVPSADTPQKHGPENFQSFVDAITGEYIAIDDEEHIIEPSIASNLPPPPTPETPDLWTPDFSFGDEFPDISPYSADDDFLNTPVVGNDDEMLSGMTLFPEGDFFGELFAPMDIAYVKPPTPPQLPDAPYTFSPTSPIANEFSPSINPSSLYPSPRLPTQHAFPSPIQPSEHSFPATASAVPPVAKPATVEADANPRRRSSATGTRKGVTPEALVPIDAPTQPRKYLAPSKTSRKDLPLVFAKKRSRSTAFGEEDDEFNEPPLPPDASEKEQIEYKRRQNTVAARRSRKRKLQYQQDLEDKVERLQRERDVWKTRAIMCQDMLVANGVQFTPFQDMIED